MLRIQEFIICLLYIVLANATQSRIVVNCDRNGFTCNMVGSKRLVVYRCPQATQNVLVNIWNFGEPSNTAWVVIKNCDDVEIDMSCTSYRRPFESLTVENVTNLKFTRSSSTVKNPAKVIITKVSNIPIIPENTFTIPNMVRYTGEASQHELQEIEFSDVHIGTIESHAFHSLRGFKKFMWQNVTVDRIHVNAIKIKFNTTMKEIGKFSISKSTIEISEYLSFQLYVKQAIFEMNKFVEIMSGGINGTIETFVFAENTVNTLQPGSISILTKNTSISENKFNYLKSGSLEHISPGLLIDSHTSFGNLEFLYTFTKNNIIYVDAGGLNPDMAAYEKVSTKFVFSSNKFSCSCENLGWLTAKISHGYSSKTLQNFYEMVKDKNASNICTGLICKRTIDILEKCNSDSLLEDLCQTTTKPTSTHRSIKKPTKSSKRIWYNSTEAVSGSNSWIYYNFKLILVSVFIISCVE